MDWNKEYKGHPVQKPNIDLWLDKHSRILEKSKGLPIIDLGCGLGNDSLYLSEHGFQVVSCDISEAALDNVKEIIPDANTLQVDMLKGLPFESASAAVIVCDLSLHYFYWNDTVNIVNDINRVLTNDGYLLCRLNSTKDFNYGAGQGVLLEENYYFVNGNTKRFFTREQIERLFCSWDMQYLSEYQMDRYQSPKILWEIAAKKP
jgi:SAM-dependent methyltransferase